MVANTDKPIIYVGTLGQKGLDFEHLDYPDHTEASHSGASLP